MEKISFPRKGVLKGVFLDNHLASTDTLIGNNQETEHIQTQTNVKTTVALINNNIHTKKIYANRKDRQSLVWAPFTTSGQEMEWVYSYNPRARTGPLTLIMTKITQPP